LLIKKKGDLGTRHFEIGKSNWESNKKAIINGINSYIKGDVKARDVKDRVVNLVEKVYSFFQKHWVQRGGAARNKAKGVKKEKKEKKVKKEKKEKKETKMKRRVFIDKDTKKAYVVINKAKVLLSAIKGKYRYVDGGLGTREFVTVKG
jgi:hypothetical protein